MKPKHTPSWWRYLLSFIWGIREKTVQSEVNGRVEVWYMHGKYVLHAHHTNYSYDSLHLVFRHTFKHIHIKERSPREVLLLGFGAGSVVSILQEELQMPCKITAIEYDRHIIDLAKEYFDIDRFSNLTLQEHDAYTFVQKEEKKYDLIVVDVFQDTEVPEKFLDEEFNQKLIRLLHKRGVVCFNFIVQNASQERKFSKLRQHYQIEGSKQEIIYWQRSNQTLVFYSS